jgi:hypothetical protein
MPFVDGTGAPLTRVALEYRGGVRFQVAEPFAWIDPRDGTRHDVAAHDLSRPASDPGNSTDLASVPPFLWGLIAGSGRQTLPAILHDGESAAIDRAPAADRLRLRGPADDAFRRALLDVGLPTARATVMWCAVRVQAHWRHARPLGVLLAVQLALSVVAIAAGIALGAAVHPLWLLLLAAPAAAAGLWGGRARFVLPAAYLAALYSPLIAAAAIASGSEYLVAWLLYAAGGGRGSAPTPGPTLRGG